jgi:hypothetical protein
MCISLSVLLVGALETRRGEGCSWQTPNANDSFDLGRRLKTGKCTADKSKRNTKKEQKQWVC